MKSSRSARNRSPRIGKSDEALAERVTFIHERIGTPAIAEQYIEGRELYVGVLGNQRLRVFPIWELEFGSMAQRARPIATEKVKHDLQYQERRGIVTGPAKDLPPQLVARIKSAVHRDHRPDAAVGRRQRLGARRRSGRAVLLPSLASSGP